MGPLSVPDEYQLNFDLNFIKFATVTLLVLSVSSRGAFGYPRCKVDLVEKGPLSFLYSVMNDLNQSSGQNRSIKELSRSQRFSSAAVT